MDTNIFERLESESVALRGGIKTREQLDKEAEAVEQRRREHLAAIKSKAARESEKVDAISSSPVARGGLTAAAIQADLDAAAERREAILRQRAGSHSQEAEEARKQATEQDSTHQQVTAQLDELQAIEARLKAADERMKALSGGDQQN